MTCDWRSRLFFGLVVSIVFAEFSHATHGGIPRILYTAVNPENRSPADAALEARLVFAPCDVTAVSCGLVENQYQCTVQARKCEENLSDTCDPGQVRIPYTQACATVAAIRAPRAANATPATLPPSVEFISPTPQTDTEIETERATRLAYFACGVVAVQCQSISPIQCSAYTQACREAETCAVGSIRVPHTRACIPTSRIPALTRVAPAPAPLSQFELLPNRCRIDNSHQRNSVIGQRASRLTLAGCASACFRPGSGCVLFRHMQFDGSDGQGAGQYCLLFSENIGTQPCRFPGAVSTIGVRRR